jgi:paired amphipathic helix protein Sin3a
MRELRVEDALLYLDQVKVEFGDRPHIYNEFLDIMKTFKTQQIDTPGVIRRVSNLFQGNKKLVLGFNTFLPEGYKIELPIDGDGPPVAVFRAPGETSVTHILTGPGAPFVASPAPAAVAGAADAAAAAARMAAPTQGRARPGPHGPAGLHEAAMRGGPPGLGQQRGPLGQQQPGGGLMGQSSVAGVASYPPGPAAHMQQQGQRPGQPGPSQQQMMSVADAATRARLEQQARGPPGQQIPGRGPHAPGAGRPGMPSMPGQQQQVMAGESQARAGMPGAPAAAHHAAAMQQNSHPIGMHAPAPPQPAAAAAPQPPLEFDHAINYVTTIKKRFSSEPETYKKFLEILHTYQKEQRGIKEVLDEVSVLFADHPDLLKEFTYFLPDAVQAQAKAQLDQVAKESEARQRAASSKQAIMQQAKGMQNRAMSLKGDRSPPQAPSVPPPVQRETTPPLQHSPPPPPPPPQPVQTVMPIPFGATQGRTVEREREIYRTVVYGTVSFAPMRPPRKNSLTVKQAAAKNGRPVMLPTLPRQPTTAETAFFERAKRHLNRKELAPDKPSGSRRHTPYTEFLKCLHLFGAGVLNKDELVLLLRGLFVQGHAPKSGVNAGGGASNPTIANDAHDLLRDFEEILVGRGQYADQETSFKDKSKYGSTRSRDFDFRDCDRPTPSYVTHPVDYPTSLFVSNSGQNEGDAKVLNNKLICVGAEKMRLSGSPEDYEAVRIRRNAYEEAMFRIEDERFEVDMAIERNAHAMRQVEPIAEEVSALRENEEKDGQPIGRCQYQLKSRTLNSIQINAIGRIYGDSGDEVIEHLSRNPLSVVPIVYQRLRQKDAEWRKQKNELMEKWRLSSEENYEGNMDYLCYFSRRELERSFGSEQLRDECRRAKNYYTNPERKANSPVDFGMSNFDRSALMYQPYCVVDMKPSSLVHHHAVRLLSQQVAIKAAKTPADREKIGRIWTEFVVPFFDYPAHWLLNEARESFQGRLNNYVVKCKLHATWKVSNHLFAASPNTSGLYAIQMQTDNA